jgi:hypothetical protein
MHLHGGREQMLDQRRPDRRRERVDHAEAQQLRLRARALADAAKERFGLGNEGPAALPQRDARGGQRERPPLARDQDRADAFFELPNRLRYRGLRQAEPAPRRRHVGEFGDGEEYLEGLEIEHDEGVARERTQSTAANTTFRSRAVPSRRRR